MARIYKSRSHIDKKHRARTRAKSKMWSTPAKNEIMNGAVSKLTGSLPGARENSTWSPTPRSSRTGLSPLPLRKPGPLTFTLAARTEARIDNSIVLTLEQPETKMNNQYSTDDYTKAFREIKLTENQLKMLQTHYNAPEKTITATQMSEIMEYKNYTASNLHYGKLGRLVGKKLGWEPTAEEAGGADAVYILAEFEKPGKEWLWIMRPEVARALEKLNLVDEKDSFLPEEVQSHERFFEGAVRSIKVNAYERSPEAREKCILHFGYTCSVCETKLSDIYGEIAEKKIHVHHLKQLSEINSKYQVDPIQDLRPVCPNCHLVIHIKNPPLTIEEAKDLIKKNRKIGLNPK